MENFSRRLAYLIEKQKLTKYSLSIKSGVSEATLGRLLKDESIKPSEKTIQKLSEYFQVSELWFRTGENESAIRNELIEKNYSSTISVKVVTTRARAGFSDAHYSEEYLQDMPTVLIEADKEYKGKYLAFEVDGDSMEPEYNKGDIVICRELKRDLWQYKLHYKEYDFVIAHGTKGVMLKEITSHNPETGEIICHSLNNDNGRNEDFPLNLKEVAFLYNVVEHRISGKSKRRNR